ncbi:MAG: hypothetical protein U0905_15410 [Pirellulales bacterium]
MVVRTLLIAAVLCFAIFSGSCQSQETQAQDGAVPKSSIEELTSQQRLLANRFSKLEELFLRMSELESSTNPARSALLLQAAKLSKEQAMVQRLNTASELLTKKQFTRAIEEQQASMESLKKLLDLLQSENRQDRIREERKKYEQWIKDIKRLERIERSLRGRTENGQDTKEASDDQLQVEKQAAEIADQMQKLLDQLDKSQGKPNAENTPKPNESKPASDKPENKPNDQKSESNPSTDDKSESNPDPKNPSKSPNPENKDSKSSDSQPSPKDSKSEPNENPSKPNPSQNESQKESSKDSQKSENGSEESSGQSPSPQEPPTPEKAAKERVERARQRMQKARENLDQKKVNEAVEEQMAAEKELKDAVAELEKILRQKREEEVERSLAALEGRFKRMLDMQIAVLDSSKKLDALSGEVRERQVEIQSSKLSLEERKILVEGQRAMLLLQEEGSSAAFPEALQQTLGDIESVVERLQKADVSKLTISIEEEIVSALEEMIESLKQEQKNREEKKKEREKEGRPPSDGGQPPEQPLVDALAELRLIKTLQLRINKRTDRMAEMLGDLSDEIGQSQDADIRNQLKELATRQDKVQQVTREIVDKLRQK